VTGVFVGTQAYIEHLRRRDATGVLINISSGAGQKPVSGWSAYCASKAAVDMFTRVVATEEPALSAWSVAPGVIDTDMQAAIRSTAREDFPAIDRFLQLKEDEAFNSGAHVARELHAIAFDPDRRPDDVVCRVRNEIQT
jgi:benzil reductase ((S)-benzoin forming)